MYLMELEASGPGGVGTKWAEKFVVLLQNPNVMGTGETHFAFVIASTDRTGTHEPSGYEVRLGIDDGFNHSTIVDGRWVLTNPRERLNKAEYRFTLSEERMEQIADAIVAGLQLW